MTEAFEIGVSLALQDGVSDAIGQARRDVAALEHAVRESGISLRSLRDVGQRSASVAFGERRREAADAPPRHVVREVPVRSAVQEPHLEGSAPRPDAVAVATTGVAPRLDRTASPPMEGAVAPRIGAVAARAASQVAGAWPARGAIGEALLTEAVPAQEAAPMARVKSAEHVAPPMPRLEALADEPFASALPGRLEKSLTNMGSFVNATIVAAPMEVAAGVGCGEDDAAIGGREIALAAAPREAASQKQPETARIFGGTETLATWGTDGTQDAPLPEKQPDLQAGPENRFPGPMSLLSALRLSGGTAVGTQGDDQSNAAGEEVAPPYNDALADTSPPASASPATMPLRRPAPGGGTPGAKERDTEHAGARDAGPQEGDVFLDGMLVGRWMSRFLNREVSRASAGPTGFDPRRGQLLPGVTVGG